MHPKKIDTRNVSTTRTLAAAASQPMGANNKMSFIVTVVPLLALLLSISAFVARVDAKPLNQNQLKFRRLPPKEFSAVYGSSITIECEAGGSPPPTIHWLKNGKRILQSDFDDNQLEDGQPTQVDEVNRIALSATRSRLFIDCADSQDEAVYTCVAENSFLRISSHTKLNLIKPLPLAPSAAGSENDLLSGVMEEVASLELAADGKQVVAGGDGEAQEKGLSAVPQCLSQRGSRSTTEPIRIHMWTHNIVEVMKNTVILYCRSNIRKQQATNSQQQQQSQHQQQEIAGGELSGSVSSSEKLKPMLLEASRPDRLASEQQQQQQRQPMALVSWSLPDDKIVGPEDKDKYEILETGDLMIKDLVWNDMGSYVCTISDGQSSDSISTFVYPASVKSSSKRAILSSRLADFR